MLQYKLLKHCYVFKGFWCKWLGMISSEAAHSTLGHQIFSSSHVIFITDSQVFVQFSPIIRFIHLLIPLAFKSSMSVIIVKRFLQVSWRPFIHNQHSYTSKINFYFCFVTRYLFFGLVTETLLIKVSHTRKAIVCWFQVYLF